MLKKLFKGLIFFAKLSFSIDPRHIIFLTLSQIDKVLLSLSLVIFPKYIIDALIASDGRRAVVFAGCLVLSQCILRPLDSWLLTQFFLARLRVNDGYMVKMHRNMAEADLARMESPEYHELRDKAQKFMYCDWHGFAYILDSAFAIIGQILTIAGMAAVLSGLSVWLIAAYTILALIDAFASAWAKKKAISLNLEQVGVERRLMYLTRILEEHRYGKEIRLFGMKNWLLAREMDANETCNRFYARARSYWMKADLACAGTNFIRLCAGYAWLLARILGGFMGIGDFTMYSAAMTSFASSMTEMLGNMVDIYQYGAYYDAMMEFLTVPKTLHDSGNLMLPDAPYEFRFENVSFRYPGREDWALRNVNLVLKHGQSFSVVGENGAGKSTFIKLLMRLYAPSEGRITLNGVDIMEIKADEYARLFSPVFQDFNLYAYSIRENVAFDGAGDVRAALDRAGLASLMERLENGAETAASRELDEGGFEPSGGEAQKIALARALYKDAPVVILDEPTAALDPRAEYEMYQQFNSMIRGKTAVFISHRMSSAQFCDRVLVFRGGCLIEEGSHDELMDRNGLYAELYGMQAGYYTK